MIKKSYYFIFFLIVLSLIPLTSGYKINQQTDLISVDTNKTFLIGTILNPVESNLTVNASALSLIYYNKDLMNEKIGIVQGLNKVSFEKQPFFYLYKPGHLYKPGPIGFIAYVFGYCTNFMIQ